MTRLLLLAALGGAALEALHATAGIDQLLTPGVEGMAFRADLDVQLGLRRARSELVAAGAAYVGFDVFGVDSWLHGLLKSRGSSNRDQPGREHEDRQCGQEDEQRDNSREPGPTPDPGLELRVVGFPEGALAEP
jgi:hypothetical protein